MKFIFDNGGQTCNKFWSYLAPIKYAYKKEEKLYVVYPDKDLSSFYNLTHNLYLRFPLYSPRINSIIKSSRWEKICRCMLGKVFHIQSIIKLIRPKSVWNSWQSHKDIDFDQIRPLVQEIFKPNEKIESSVTKIFEEKHSIYDVIVGLHIRRADYRQWMNGKFYYTDDEYLECCRRIIKLFPEKKVVFFIASTERIQETSFSEIDFFQIPEATGPIDLFALSKCDYIFGPPSTFSNWAAFYGNRPIQFIENIKSFDPSSLDLEKYVYPTWSGDCK